MAIPLIECTPSFSEGRRPDVIEAIMTPFRKTPGCHLLYHRADEEQNRLILTLAGRPAPVKEALMTAAKIALETVDMNTHDGRHPGIGAVDVIRFAPIDNLPMEACVSLARDFGRELFHETEIPIYFYGEAAIRRGRRRLSEIRRGGYELLKIEASIPERQPDLGEPKLHPTAGAAVIGAGKSPVTIDISLRTGDLDAAAAIADAVSTGRRHVEATARSMDDRGMVQIRITVSDPDAAPLYRVLEMVRVEARQYGIPVADTEIPGMISAAALARTAAYYLQAAGLSPDRVLEFRLLKAMGEGE